LGFLQHIAVNTKRANKIALALVNRDIGVRVIFTIHEFRMPIMGF